MAKKKASVGLLKKKTTAVRKTVVQKKTSKKSAKKAAKKVRARKSFGRESKAAKVDRLHEIIDLFQRYYPDAHCALNHSNPLELLVATIMSAQCTDERVNIVTEHLFKKYRSAKDYAEAPVEELENMIRSVNFYRNKSKNIKAMAQSLLEKHDGEVPQTMDELVALAGVGRKTANVVLGNAFRIPSGVVVDTHVSRLSNRLGFVKGRNPEIIARELEDLVEKENWIEFPHWMIDHGRQVCKARKPQCDVCFLEAHCPQIIE